VAGENVRLHINNIRILSLASLLQPHVFICTTQTSFSIENYHNPPRKAQSSSHTVFLLHICDSQRKQRQRRCRTSGPPENVIYMILIHVGCIKKLAPFQSRSSPQCRDVDPGRARIMFDVVQSHRRAKSIVCAYFFFSSSFKVFSS
jgi:hypothetical protein